MISVIIPTYNGEKKIGECIKSLLLQTKKPDEIIVVDDGSTDNTVKIIKHFRGVKIIEKKHSGPAASRNLGAKKSKGKILLFTDDDCVVDKNWVLEMSKPFKDSEVVGVQGTYSTKQKNVISRYVQLEIEDRYERMKKHKKIDFIGSYSAGYRKEVFMKYGGFDETFPEASGEDPELSFKISKDGHKMVLNEKAIVFHKHVDSFGKYVKQKYWRAYWRVLLYKKHPGKMKTESYTPQVIKLQIILLTIFTLSLFFSLFSEQLFYLSLSSIIILIISVVPLSLKNMKNDLSAGIITPILSLARTIVFMLGLFWGMIKL